MPALTVVRPGMFTTVQDLGRWGYQAFGVPPSGAMDLYSHRRANRLVGNDDRLATLEATLIGPEIAFEQEVDFAVAGAEFVLTLDGHMVGTDQALTAKGGSLLKFGERRRGARAYLAVAGGIDVPEVLGSRSTHTLSRIGGLQGRALKAGDHLPIGRPSAARRCISEKALDLFPDGGGARLRVLPGEDPALTSYLTSRRFTLTPRSDRMGYRLEGERSAGLAAGELISRAVITGAIQVPPTGEPILLMADHATTGGYAVAATVITADLSLAAQLTPGDWIQFTSTSLGEAQRALRDRERSLERA